jgi:small-conductance mechanosensitive channel
MENSFDLIRGLLTGMVNTLPKIIGCLVILLLGFLISRLIASIIRATLTKIGLDRWGKQLEEIDFIQKNNLKIKLSGILSKTVYYFLMLIFIVAATDVLGLPALSDLFKNILNYLPNILVALVLLLVGVFVSDQLKKAILTTGKSLGIPSAGLLAHAIFYFVLVNFLMAALGQLQVDTVFIESNLLILIAGVAAAFAIGYGLASKTIVANILAAFYTKDKFKIGDEVTIDGLRGEVYRIDKSSITLVLADAQKAIIPLAKITEGSILIHREAMTISGGPETRILEK